MKFAKIDRGNGAEIAMVTDSGLQPLSDRGRPIAAMNDLIALSDEARKSICDAASTGDIVPFGACKVLPPVEPRKFLALGMNFAKHAEEARQLGIAVPNNMVWFNKQTSCLNGPYGDIEKSVTEKLDYEVELGVVIGKAAKSVKAQDALDHIFGYLVVNDVSARDWQMHSATITMGKSFDTHGPVGPWIVTKDEIPDPNNLSLYSKVNGEIRQQSTTADFIYKVQDQIEYLTTAFTLEPGDLIATGTPEGVGIARNPPALLDIGDIVECGVEGIGEIRNRVVA